LITINMERFMVAIVAVAVVGAVVMTGGAAGVAGGAVVAGAATGEGAAVGAGAAAASKVAITATTGGVAVKATGWAAFMIGGAIAESIPDIGEENHLNLAGIDISGYDVA
jgi:hypothetical protein